MAVLRRVHVSVGGCARIPALSLVDNDCYLKNQHYCVSITEYYFLEKCTHTQEFYVSDNENLICNVINSSKCLTN